MKKHIFYLFFLLAFNHTLVICSQNEDIIVNASQIDWTASKPNILSKSQCEQAKQANKDMYFVSVVIYKKDLPSLILKWVAKHKKPYDNYAGVTILCKNENPKLSIEDDVKRKIAAFGIKLIDISDKTDSKVPESSEGEPESGGDNPSIKSGDTQDSISDQNPLPQDNIEPPSWLNEHKYKLGGSLLVVLVGYLSFVKFKKVRKNRKK